MKYIILADCSIGFDIPRQLTEINGERLIERTIRLLKENNVNDIIITSHDSRFDNLGAVRYEPKNNYYIPHKTDYKRNKGYWLNAFPIELINEPVTFLFGDVYYSEDSIKKIVNEKTDSTLFFCTYQNKDKRYIKKHDEPLGYKVVDYELFKRHIEIVKKLKDKGLCVREPIVWELYRSINNLNVNEHKLGNNVYVINDESCDIDSFNDIIYLKIRMGGNCMIKCEAILEFTYGDFSKLKNLVRKEKEVEGRIFEGDTFECTEEIAEYLGGKNDKGVVAVKVIEVIPEKKVEKVEEVKEEKEVKEKPKKKKTKRSK